MSKNLNRKISLLLMLLIPMLGFAQPKLSINSARSFPPDTIYYPNTGSITYTLVVENIGDNQLTSPCQIKFKYNSATTDTIMWSWLAFNFEVGQTDTIIFTDSIGPLGGTRYKGGDNIIVIWPNSDNPNVQIPDTVDFPIWIQQFNGVIDEETLAQRVEVFPNPVTDKLNIHYKDMRQKVECVRIIGLDGKKLWESYNPVDEIDTQQLPAGMYLLLFKYKDGMVGAVRITK
ncbi:MAG: T9SS type A sorting domain-containing protein [Bacteroidetes bacterium]|nr:T9SS type A sorting domain-containing protein [Bacteroidota bacterium]MBL0014911.1 T9SS type A sorting domain-containing protein [Bacteroidota bacterium]MBP6640212.1 T9SS type A sorting domain-containing protein [Bacteroidia bacterium]MBP6721435.1 T9SS type A sorting domain-containing protein [Bacteroidia bacterium]